MVFVFVKRARMNNILFIMSLSILFVSCQSTGNNSVNSNSSENIEYSSSVDKSSSTNNQNNSSSSSVSLIGVISSSDANMLMVSSSSNSSVVALPIIKDAYALYLDTINGLPPYLGDDVETWNIQSYIVDKYSVNTDYGMPRSNVGMDDIEYASSLDLITYIEKKYNISYVRIVYHTGITSDDNVYLANKIDTIIRSMNAVRLYSNQNKIYASFVSVNGKTVGEYIGQIFLNGVAIDDNISMLRELTDIPI